MNRGFILLFFTLICLLAGILGMIAVKRLHERSLLVRLLIVLDLLIVVRMLWLVFIG